MNPQNIRNFGFCEGEGKDPSTSLGSKICKKLKWFVTVSRNSIVLLASSLVAYVMVDIYHMENDIHITGEVKPGIPAWNLPWRFGLATRNESAAEVPGPVDLAQDFGIGLIMLPLVSIIQIVAIVHNFSRKQSLSLCLQ